MKTYEPSSDGAHVPSAMSGSREQGPRPVRTRQKRRPQLTGRALKADVWWRPGSVPCCVLSPLRTSVHLLFLPWKQHRLGAASPHPPCPPTPAEAGLSRLTKSGSFLTLNGPSVWAGLMPFHGDSAPRKADGEG